ncbi:MAG: DNA recombination protein RmuC, partial [Clostridia bacterium]|nr:DNA recombination protein RmuC [Clostridia bacterium]
METTILFILFGIIIVLLGVCLFLLISLKKNGNDGAIFDELRYNREEMANGSRASREEVTRGLEKVDTRLNALREENYKSRIDMTEKITESLNVIRQNNIEQNDRQTRFIVESVAKLQESNEKKLEEMRVTVDEKLTSTLTTRLNSSFKTVSEQLENVYKSLGEMKELSQGVTNNVTSLNRVLTNVKARGTWAEVQLESLLDQTIPGMYIKNYSPKTNGERVEFAVKIPSGEGKDEVIYLPIDSKFPMEDYIRLCNAAESADPELLKSARKALEDRVLAEAKDVKKYIEPPK